MFTVICSSSWLPNPGLSVSPWHLLADLLSANLVCHCTRVASGPFEGKTHGDGNITMSADRIGEDQKRQSEPDLQTLQLGAYLELASHISSSEGNLLVSVHDFGPVQNQQLIHLLNLKPSTEVTFYVHDFSSFRRGNGCPLTRRYLERWPALVPFLLAS